MQPLHEGTSKISLLIVEDDLATRDAVSKLVQLKFPDLVIHTAENGTAGLESFCMHGPDIILTDINMPEMDGIRMAEEIRAITPAALIIIISAFSDTHYLMSAIEIGIARYIPKPIHQKLLFEAIEDCVHRISLERQVKAQDEHIRKLSHAVEQSPVSISITNTSGEIEFVNPKFTRMTGYSLEEVLGKKPRILESGETSPEGYRGLWDTISSGRVWEGEFHNRKKNGELFWEKASIAPIADNNGAITNYIVIKEDITDHKQADEALRKSEQNFRALSEQFNALLDALPDSIFLLDAGNRIVWANKALTREYGADAAGLEGTHCYHSLRKRPAPCEECPALRSFATGRLEQTTITTPDTRTIDLRTVPVFDADGRVRGVIEIARDITEQKKVEAQLLHVQKMEAIGTLAGGIAHDFNNILTTIIGYGSLLQMKLDGDSPLLRNVDNILSAADRAKVLTQGLLAYSRREVLDLRPVDLNSILKKIDQLLSRIIGEDIELKVMPSADELYLLADAGQLEQVLMSLATNSRDAMPQGGSLLIGARETVIDAQFIAAHGFGAEGRYALLTISDTGEGMNEATRKRIFEPFFTTKEVGKGTGLGLSIAYGIVKQHHGFITAYSAPGNGTTFRIYLPLIDRAPEENHRDVQLPERGKGETVLLVEDSEEIRSFLRELLVDYGYRVIEAVDGNDGVEKFRSHHNHIQLLLLDIIMPRKNGKETYEVIRSEAPEIKALFMSGYTADIISRKGIDTEGLEFISKPLYPHAILRKVREVLDQPPNGGMKR